MVKRLVDIVNLKGSDVNEIIVNDLDVVNYFEENGLAGCDHVLGLGIGQDYDFDELLNYLDSSIDVEIQFINDKGYVKLYDKEVSIMVKAEEIENRFDEDSPTEIFYDFNDIIVLN